MNLLAGNSHLTPEQTVLVLREASKRHNAGLHLKSAGLIDSDELEPLRHVISRSNKLIDATQKKETVEARVSNE